MRIPTPQEATEPDVIVMIPFDRLTLDVPHVVEELLWRYSECRRDGENLVFSIPAYLYRKEIEPAMWRTAYEYVYSYMPFTHLTISKGVREGRSPAEILATLPPRPNMSQRLFSQIEGAIKHLFTQCMRHPHAAP